MSDHHEQEHEREHELTRSTARTLRATWGQALSPVRGAFESLRTGSRRTTQRASHVRDAISVRRIFAVYLVALAPLITLGDGDILSLARTHTALAARYRDAAGAETLPEISNLTAADCRLAIETDDQLYAKFGSVSGTTTYVTELIAAVSDRYFTDVQCTMSIAYLGNVVDLLEHLDANDVAVDLYSDQTSCHVSYDGGYTPAGVTFEEGRELLASLLTDDPLVERGPDMRWTIDGKDVDFGWVAAPGEPTMPGAVRA